MQVVRAASMDDVDALYDLITKSNFGLTTLKITKDQLSERIEQSEFSFRRKITKPSGQPYVFVMENQGDGRLTGTCSIYSKVGGYEPFYAYRIETSVHESEMLGIRKEIRVLHLQREHNGPTEIGSLFLDPDFRGGGLGRLLSQSRFLFMAEQPERFDKEVIAEMRGNVSEDGQSVFWDAIGSHFFEIEFPRAEMLTTVSKNFIGDLMPRHPIYIPLLPPQAQATIGVVHRQTEPALAMLRQEGFRHRDLIDIFDGGPVVHCETLRVRTIKSSCKTILHEITDEIDSPQMLISNAQDDFRACLGRVHVDDEGRATIDRVTALTLQLKLGKPFRFVSLKPTEEELEEVNKLHEQADRAPQKLDTTKQAGKQATNE